MADIRKVTIEIVSKSGGGGNNQAKKPVDENGQLKKELETLLHPIKTAEEKILGKNVLVNQAYQNAKNAIIKSIDLSLRHYYNLKEDYLGENTYNIARTSISKVSGCWTSVIGGAIIGAEFGSTGALIGAGIGAATYGITETINWKSTMSNYNQSINASSYQVSFMRQRAGLTNGSKGTEN